MRLSLLAGPQDKGAGQDAEASQSFDPVPKLLFVTVAPNIRNETNDTADDCI